MIEPNRPPRRDHRVSVEIDRICDEFEKSLKAGLRPRVDDFADLIDPAAREELRAELRAVDDEWAARLRERPSTSGAGMGGDPDDGGTFFRLDGAAISETAGGGEARRPESFGHLILTAKVGEGGFGEVWRAHDPWLERDVAVKIPHDRRPHGPPDGAFLAEARALARLRHPNIVSVYEVGMRDGRAAYICSEFIDGPDLKAWLRGNAPSVTEAARLFLKLARGLAHAHECGIVHRDLKPANVLVSREGEPLLTDFGLSKRLGRTDPFGADGVIAGSFAYMSPEQAEGRDVGVRSDVYSLGVILFELLAGRPPFRGSGPEVLRSVVAEPPPSVRASNGRVPDDLARVVAKCLAKRPEDRYGSAAALAADVDHFLAGRPLAGLPTSGPRRAVKWLSRHRRGLAAVVATAVISSGAVASLVWRGLANEAAAARTVTVRTSPPGAKVTFVRVDPVSGDPDPGSIRHAAGRTPLSHGLAGGDYLVVAVMDDGRFAEVNRHVPGEGESFAGLSLADSWRVEAGRVELPVIDIPPRSVAEGMVLVPGAERFGPVVDAAGRRSPEWNIPPFYADAREFRVEDLEAMASERPGLRRVLSDVGGPSAEMSLARAAYLAELAGKRLPTAGEMNYLTERLAAPGADDGPIAGLRSGLWEWVSTRPGGPMTGLPSLPQSGRWGAMRLLGGGPAGAEGTANGFILRPERSRAGGLGARFVRSAAPRVRPEDFPRPDAPPSE